MDGNYYLIAMFNDKIADHVNRVRDVAGDPLIQSARISMGVDQDPSLEATLQWFRWPLNWVAAEKTEGEGEMGRGGCETGRAGEWAGRGPCATVISQCPFIYGRLTSTEDMFCRR